jgi:S-DNA-T family DNA segregation ATPase FtsK/SpoIIIE
LRDRSFMNSRGDGPGRILAFPDKHLAPRGERESAVASPPGAGLEPAPEPLEGELLTDEQSAAVDARLHQRVTRVVHQIIMLVVVVGESERTSTAVGKAVVRVFWTIVQGFGSWIRRAYDGLTHGVYRRQIKAHESMGNQEQLAEWVDRYHKARDQRHKRILNLPMVAFGVVQVAAGAVAALIGLVILLGVFVAVSGAGPFMGVVHGTLDLARWISTIVGTAWRPLVLLTPLAITAGAWKEGRRCKTPGWLATTADADVDVTIDETSIANALKALRIPQINEYLKQGFPIQFITTARRDGRGTSFAIRLPHGVTADMIAQPQRRAQFAGSLYRATKEVWLKTGSEASILEGWAADKGALAEGAGPYPLLDKGTVDVFKGVPFGKTLRGDPILAPVIGRNTIVGGMPGQGKSSAARVIMVGFALDPTAELRIWVPDSNFDFDAFQPRCSRYVMGAEPEKIAEILAHLQELHAEVQTRGDLLVKYRIPEVTREWASKDVGLHPLVCLLEEAHVAFQDPNYGQDICQLVIDIVRLGRKRAIHMIVSTQAPTKDSIPRDVTRNCSNGIAFSVGDHVANDALLGQGAYRGGHRATELIPGTDIGTALVKGFSGQRSEMVQAYFLSVENKRDQVTPIIKRALDAMDRRGVRLVPAEAPTAIGTVRDLLEDLDAVLDNEPVRAADVPALLSRLAPEWVPYRRMTGKTLRVELAKRGVKVASTGNVWPVDPVAVRQALATRSTEDLDDWSS